MLPSERIDFSAISQRPKLALPDGARLAVWVIVDIEEWDSTQPMPRMVLTPRRRGADARQPELGLARIRQPGRVLADARGARPFPHPGGAGDQRSAIQRYGPIARSALERGWEFIGHGFTQQSMQKVADEREDIRKAAAAIRDFTGKHPRG